MSDQELFERWFNLLAKPAQIEEYCGTSTPWEEEYNQGLLMGLVNTDGAGLELICEGEPYGDEILLRLKQVYLECAETGDEMPSSFKEMAVPTSSQHEVEALLSEHAKGILAIARAADSEDGIQSAGNPVKLQRVENRDDVQKSDDDGFLNSEMFDAFEDKFGPDAESRENTNLILLHEPLYQWSWDEYAVANYVLWPIYRGNSGLYDPRRPAYELLKRGVHHGYTEPGVINYWFDSQ